MADKSGKLPAKSDQAEVDAFLEKLARTPIVKDAHTRAQDSVFLSVSVTPSSGVVPRKVRKRFSGRPAWQTGARIVVLQI